MAALEQPSRAFVWPHVGQAVMLDVPQWHMTTMGIIVLASLWQPTMDLPQSVRAGAMR